VVPASLAIKLISRALASLFEKLQGVTPHHGGGAIANCLHTKTSPFYMISIPWLIALHLGSDLAGPPNLGLYVWNQV